MHNFLGSSLCFLVLAWLLMFVEACQREEREALISFGKDLVFSDGTSFHWGNDEDCCQWLPVACNQDGHITELSFGFANMMGQRLLLIRGTNSLNPSLQQLRYLEYLNLDSINFGGAQLPYWIGSFTDLRYIDLSGCSFGGSLPVQLTNLINLEVLDLPSNKFKGPIPEGFGNLTSLQVLNFSDNLLQGGIPVSLGNLCFLDEIDISSNNLSGDLGYLDLSYNIVTLNFSSTWSPMFRATVLRLTGCKLGSRFPAWLQSQLDQLTFLDISVAGISDMIPKWFSDTLTSSSLCYLNVSHNEIQGQLPTKVSLVWIDDSYCPSEYAAYDFSSNLMQGLIPSFPELTAFINLSNNSFSGPLSSLCETQAPNLEFLDVSQNLLSGEVPKHCIGQYKNMKVLNLANNKLYGPIPSSIWSLESLHMLNLRGNSFRGELPHSSDCTELQFLDLSHNQLSGNIPAWIGQRLSSLTLLSLRAMARKQNLTSMLKQSYELSIQVAPNYNQGIIVYTVAGDYIYNAFLMWLGKVREYSKILGYVVLIDVSDNNLSGEIPAQVAHLTELVVLNLSRNHFSSIIPSNIGQLKNLQVLDLSRNQLSGSVPTGMSELTFLSWMDLSYNNLSGKIPTSTQILGFDPSRFAGNLDLCGLPFKLNCPEDDDYHDGGDVLHYPGNGENDDDDDEFYKWFYIAIGVGFAVSFSLTFGTLLLNRSWRHAYFHLLDDFGDRIFVAFVLQKRKLKARLQR